MADVTKFGLIRAASRRRTGPYSGTAIILHWTVAALVVVQYATKLVPTGAFEVLSEDRLDALHVSIGPTILALMAIRLAWRLTHRVPAPPGDLPLALQLVSRATHWLFYAILLLLPILGWIAASAYRETAYLLGILPLPALVPPNERLGGQTGEIHGMLAWTLLGIIALHLAGVMYHALVKKDGVLGRMLPTTNGW